MLVEFPKSDAIEAENWDKRNKVIVARNSSMAQSAISFKMLVRVDKMTATNSGSGKCKHSNSLAKVTSRCREETKNDSQCPTQRMATNTDTVIPIRRKLLPDHFDPRQNLFYFSHFNIPSSPHHVLRETFMQAKSRVTAMVIFRNWIEMFSHSELHVH
mmetsp:Transcript_20342/g.42286  ORF Transcript_20342/g.42286 Transcript_20342/m.42286 type:complete len:158 (-) Transcript_20342:778-1251(-)